MTTIVCGISRATIAEHDGKCTVLRDKRLDGFHFKYAKKTRRGSFYLRLFYKGKDRWVKLGKFPAIDVATAKAALKVEMKKFSVGTQTDEQLGEVDLNTVADVMLWYLKYIEVDGFSEKQLANIKSLVKCQILFRIGHLKIARLTRFQLSELLYRGMMVDNLALGTFEQALIRLKAAFSRASKLDLLDDNVIAELSMSDFTNKKPEPKGTRLKVADLPWVVRAVVKANVEAKMMAQLVAVFAVRVGEAAGARWNEFDFDGGTWVVPESRVKNKKKHTLYLPALMIELLRVYKREQFKRGRASVFLFPQRKTKRKHISANSASRRITLLFDKRCGAHDFRKIAKDWWIENGVDYIISEFLLNHTIKGVDKHYIATDAAIKQQEATEKWMDYLATYGFFGGSAVRQVLKVA